MCGEGLRPSSPSQKGVVVAVQVIRDEGARSAPGDAAQPNRPAGRSQHVTVSDRKPTAVTFALAGATHAARAQHDGSSCPRLAPPCAGPSRPSRGRPDAMLTSGSSSGTLCCMEGPRISARRAAAGVLRCEEGAAVASFLRVWGCQGRQWRNSGRA